MRGSWARSLLPQTTPVRTIYVPVLRSLVPPMHELFDFADPSQIKGQREVTTVASQALFLMNNEIVEEASITLPLLATKLDAPAMAGEPVIVEPVAAALSAFVRAIAGEA